MAVVNGLDILEKDVKRSKTALERLWKKAAVQVAAFAYDAVCAKTEETDSVDTGVYLASHRITQGRRTVLEHPTRPERGDRYSSQKRKGEPPIFRNARSAGLPVEGVLAAQLRPGNFAVENDQEYAEYLENGSTTIDPPRRIYATAERKTQTFIRRLRIK